MSGTPYGGVPSRFARVHQLIKSEASYQVTPYLGLTQQGVSVAVHPDQFDVICDLCGTPCIVTGLARVGGSIEFAVCDQDGTARELLNRVSRRAPRRQGAHGPDSGVVGHTERDAPAHRMPDKHDRHARERAADVLKGPSRIPDGVELRGVPAANPVAQLEHGQLVGHARQVAGERHHPEVRQRQRWHGILAVLPAAVQHECDGSGVLGAELPQVRS